MEEVKYETEFYSAVVRSEMQKEITIRIIRKLLKKATEILKMRLKFK